MLHRAAPLVRVKPRNLVKAGVERVPRVEGVRDGKPLLPNGRVLDVSNVIWCTGYRHGFSWIQLPIFDASGDPIHERGVVASTPGLYFVGLHFQYAMSSATLIGVGRDAEFVVEKIQARSQKTLATAA
jgi:putative flavoprotein involved in K+ transport